METRSTIAIVGYGPSGMTAAAILGQAGHDVIVIERWPNLYGLPRLTHIDDETARILQGICDVDKALADSTPTRYEWVNGKDELLLEIPTVMGNQLYPQHISIYQPDIEDAIDERLRQLPNVEIRQGWVVLEARQDDGSAELDIAEWRGKDAKYQPAETLKVDYVIGADGAKSVIREAIGTDRTDYGFLERWINIDIEWLRPRDEKFAIAKQFCDPARGHMFMGIGQNRQRFEFALLEDEATEDFTKEEAAWKWLEAQHGLGKDDVKIARHLAYTFAGRVAEQWRDRRIFLAGDAAHVMPPYLGQGACSGIRDAANLAWKLDLVLRGIAAEQLLDSYQEERMPHATATVLASIELGKVANMTDPQAAEHRDHAFKTGQVPPPKPLPRLSGAGFADSDSKAIGVPAPQSMLQTDEGPQPADKVTGTGFRLVGRPEALAALNGSANAILQQLDVATLKLNDQTDPEGVYASYLESHGIDAFIQRPDHLVFGVAPSDQISALVTELGSRLVSATVQAGQLA